MGRRKAWSVEPLEGRDLLSVTPMMAQGAGRLSTARALAISSANPINNNDGGSGITLDIGSTPTNRELVRRAFKGVFTGRVVAIAPRLADQARAFYIVAPGGTNQFLHGTLQMQYFTPSASANLNPSPTDNNAFSGGALSMLDRNTNNGAALLADLQGAPTSVDTKGRPTGYNFILNGGGGSGGIYASSVGNGTVKISYQGKQARVVIVGSVFVQGIGQPLAVSPSSIRLG